MGQYLNFTGGATLGVTTFTSTVDALTKSTVGLASVDNTDDASKPLDTALVSALVGKRDSLTAGATSGAHVLSCGATVKG